MAMGAPSPPPNRLAPSLDKEDLLGVELWMAQQQGLVKVIKTTVPSHILEGRGNQGGAAAESQNSAKLSGKNVLTL